MVRAACAVLRMPFPPPWLSRSLEGVIAWMLDRPRRPAPCGQACDRLRPQPILRELQRALAGRGHDQGELVEWQWNQRLHRADGWLWQDSQLHRFRWWRGDNRLELHAELHCTTEGPLRSLE